MKIFYVYTALTTIGGADKVIIQKANWLADNGFEVTIITESQANRPIAFSLSAKVDHIDLGVDFSKEYGHSFPVRAFIYFKLMRKYRQKLQSYIYKNKPDIVITTLGRDLGIITDLKDSSKKIGEAHTTLRHLRNFHLIEERGGIYKGIAKFFRHRLVSQAKKLNALVLLTEQDKKDWQGITKTLVIPNAIPSLPDKISTCEKKRAIVVGRYNHAKGYEYLIKAWKIVHEKHPDWIVDIFGSGELHDEVKTLINDNHLDKTMIMNQPTTNIMDEYYNSSICIVSSRYEGFSMVILEAMASGIPCVAFDCPFGPRNIIKDNEDGFLVEYLNYEDLADKICILIENSLLRSKMGSKARENILRFSQETIMKQWIELFNSL